MRIGLNLLYLIPGVVGGTETYADGLLSGLSEIDDENEYFIFLSSSATEWSIPEKSNFHKVICKVDAISRMHRYLYEQFTFTRIVKKYNIDVLHSLGYVTPFVIKCASVVSILDLVYEYPGAFTYVKKQVLRALVTVSACRANHVITISKASQSQIVKSLRIPLEKTTVTLLATKKRVINNNSSWDDLRGTLQIQGNYLLAFSSLSPSKNIPVLLKAFSQLPANVRSDLKLVLVGHIPKKGVPLRELSEELGVFDSIIFTGYLSDSDLALVLKNARIFVFPSLYEGFGIPILEAMEVGVPVVCSRVASLPEVSGSAALHFDPDSPSQLTSALYSLLSNTKLCEYQVKAGYENICRFSWKDTARKSLQVYEKVYRNT